VASGFGRGGEARAAGEGRSRAATLPVSSRRVPGEPSSRRGAAIADGRLGSAFLVEPVEFGFSRLVLIAHRAWASARRIARSGCAAAADLAHGVGAGAAFWASSRARAARQARGSYPPRSLSGTRHSERPALLTERSRRREG
jgi:hypothetical protein